MKEKDYCLKREQEVSSSSPSRVWGEAPADKWFGAYPSQKEQLWWQQLLWIFIRINLNFCTNTRLF